jgi:hypothetical protein
LSVGKQPDRDDSRWQAVESLALKKKKLEVP